MFIFMCSYGAALAQQTDPQFRLAQALEKNNQYEEALKIYQSLYHKNKKITIINGIKRCYIALQNYPELIDFLTNVIRYQRSNNTWNIDLAEAYYLNNQQEKALRIWRDQLKNSNKNVVIFRLVASAMIRQRLYEDAIKVYKEAISQIPNQFNLHIDIANLYKIQLDYGSSAKHFLEYYIHNPKRKVFLQRQILSLCDRKDQIIPVITSLKNFITQHSEQFTINEVLAGIYIKERAFDNAFKIYKSLESEVSKGNFLHKFASEAFKNEAFEHVIKSYNLLLEKYPNSPHKSQALYHTARAYTKLAYKNKEELNSDLAASHIQKAIELFDRLTSITNNIPLGIQSYINLGDIYFHFYNDVDRAIANYNLFINKSPQNNARDEAIIKLGDVFLTKNQIDAAMKSYLLVQHKEFRNLAQFKVCEIYFFSGKFSAAQDKYNKLLTQIGIRDPLANDILHRQFIINSFTKDSLALVDFAHAELLYFQQKLSEAAEKMYSLYLARIALSPVAGRRAVKILFMLNKYTEAKELVVSFRDTYSEDDHIDEVIFLLAQIEEHMENYEAALNLYKEIFSKYPNSLFIHDAREKARKIKGRVESGVI
jgi:tetratricopeptide (TPR) repeat protein